MDSWVLHIGFTWLIFLESETSVICFSHSSNFRFHFSPFAPQMGFSRFEKQSILIVAASPLLMIFFLPEMLFSFYCVFLFSVRVLQESSSTPWSPLSVNFSHPCGSSCAGWHCVVYCFTALSLFLVGLPCLRGTPDLCTFHGANV